MFTAGHVPALGGNHAFITSDPLVKLHHHHHHYPSEYQPLLMSAPVQPPEVPPTEVPATCSSSSSSSSGCGGTTALTQNGTGGGGSGGGQSSKDTTYTKIFVGGLPYHTTDKSLRKFFESFGEIEEAVVITDRQTGKSRGYGFVTMADRESAERAVKDANPIIDGRKANVNLAFLGAKPRQNNNTSNGLTFPVRGAFSFQAATAFPVQANAFPAAAAYGQNCGQGFGAGYGAQGFPNPYGAASSAFPFFGGGGAVYGANGAFGALGGFGVAPAAGFGGLQSGASGQYPFYGGPGSLAGPPEGYSNLSLNQSNPI